MSDSGSTTSPTPSPAGDGSSATDGGTVSGDPTVTLASGDATGSTGTATGDTTTGDTTTGDTTAGGTTTSGDTATSGDTTTTGGTTTGTDPAAAPPLADPTAAPATAPSAGAPTTATGDATITTPLADQTPTAGDAAPPAPPETPPATSQPPATPIGPVSSATLQVCPAPLVPPQVTGMTGLGLLIGAPLSGGFGLLSHSLMSTGLPGSGLRAGIGDVIEHVRDLTRQAKGAPAQTPGGSNPPPLPTPAPAPPAPPAPSEQSGGSSVSGGSHGHHKGGNSYAVVAGALLVLFLRPLALARLTRSSGCSRSFRPLVLPG